MSEIFDRVQADPTLRDLFHIQPRHIQELTDGLNALATPTKVPEQVTAVEILDTSYRAFVMFDLLNRAAAGESVQQMARELLSPEGTTVMIDGFVPPIVYLWDVANALYEPNGDEKTE